MWTMFGEMYVGYIWIIKSDIVENEIVYEPSRRMKWDLHFDVIDVADEKYDISRA